MPSAKTSPAAAFKNDCVCGYDGVHSQAIPPLRERLALVSANGCHYGNKSTESDDAASRFPPSHVDNPTILFGVRFREIQFSTSILCID
jgi:hypothetical protein